MADKLSFSATGVSSALLAVSFIFGFGALTAGRPRLRASRCVAEAAYALLRLPLTRHRNIYKALNPKAGIDTA